MDRSQAKCHKFILLLLIVTLISTSAWCSSQVSSHDRASDLTKEEAITSFRAVQQVYTIILENYVPPVQPERLIHSVLTRLSGLMGNDQLSFEGKGKSFVLSSSGKAIQLDLNSDAKSGGKQMIRLLTFVAETNKDQGEQVLARNAIEAMLTIDAASSYFNQADYSEMTTEGSQLGGIGLEIAIKDGQITVLTPIEDSPALRAGILEGDRITVIDGRPTQGMNLAEVVKLLRGPKGSEIALTVVRDSLPEPRTFTIIRRIITFQNVKYTVIGKDQGYIRITQFRDKTAQHVSKAIEGLLKQNSESGNKLLKGIILDLRNNTGGLLEEAIKVAELFLAQGLIVRIVGKKPEKTMEFYVHKGNKVTIGSLIILTNKRTAGGSEIVAGSLQDHGRALIIGSTTLMRGSIQTVFPLADGSAIRLTTAYWQRSSGAPIENLGVVPDIAIDIQNQKMITELEQDDAVRLACQILDKSVSSKIDDLKAAAQGLIQGSN